MKSNSSSLKVKSVNWKNNVKLSIWSVPKYCTHSLVDKCTCGFKIKVTACNIREMQLPHNDDNWHCLFTWIFKYKYSSLRIGQVISLIDFVSSNDTICRNLSHYLILQRNTNVPSSLFSLPEYICLKFPICDESSIIDRTFNSHITRILNIRMATCEILAALSTLGGAFSCLGESGDLNAAQTAGCIALRQLILSRRIEDPNLIIRCYIYHVYSLCQRGLKRRAIKFIRQLIYPNLQRLANRNKIDEPVKKMYIAACHKVRYMTKSHNQGKRENN